MLSKTLEVPFVNVDEINLEPFLLAAEELLHLLEEYERVHSVSLGSPAAIAAANKIGPRVEVLYDRLEDAKLIGSKVGSSDTKMLAEVVAGLKALTLGLGILREREGPYSIDGIFQVDELGRAGRSILCADDFDSASEGILNVFKGVRALRWAVGRRSKCVLPDPSKSPQAIILPHPLHQRQEMEAHLSEVTPVSDLNTDKVQPRIEPSTHSVESRTAFPGAGCDSTKPVDSSRSGTDQNSSSGRVHDPENPTARRLAPCHLKAMSQFLDAQRKSPDLEGATDRSVYDWVKEHSDDDDLPDFDSWMRYLRVARNATGTQKNSPRGGRASRSIVRVEQIESNHEPDQG